MPKSAWMAFFLHFPIAILCLKEQNTVFLKRANFDFFLVAASIWFLWGLNLNIPKYINDAFLMTYLFIFVVLVVVFVVVFHLFGALKDLNWDSQIL